MKTSLLTYWHLTYFHVSLQADGTPVHFNIYLFPKHVGLSEALWVFIDFELYDGLQA